MMRRALFPIKIIVLSMFLLGCEKEEEKDNRFYFLSGSSGGGVDLFVNGNPTNGGKALMGFLVDGKNTIELKGDISDDGYHLMVFLGESIFDMESKKIVDRRRDGPVSESDRNIDFHAVIRHEWVWQKAELLGPLSDEDQTSILAIFDGICDEIGGEDFSFDAVLDRDDVILWSDAAEHTERLKSMIENAKGKIPPRSELVFESVDHDDLRWLTGKQIVMLTSDEDKLVYLGPSEEAKEPSESGEVKWTFYYGFSEMFFARIDGEWKLLLPNL